MLLSAKAGNVRLGFAFLSKLLPCTAWLRHLPLAAEPLGSVLMCLYDWWWVPTTFIKLQLRRKLLPLALLTTVCVYVYTYTCMYVYSWSPVCSKQMEPIQASDVLTSIYSHRVWVLAKQ